MDRVADHRMSDDELLAFLDAAGPHRQAGHRPGRRAAPRGPDLVRPRPGHHRDGSPIGDIVFNTGADTLKGKALRRDPRVALCVDDERPPFSFVTIEGVATISEELVGGRPLGRHHRWPLHGAERAEEYGRRNGVPGELAGPGPTHPHRRPRRLGQLTPDC